MTGEILPSKTPDTSRKHGRKEHQKFFTGVFTWKNTKFIPTVVLSCRNTLARRPAVPRPIRDRFARLRQVNPRETVADLYELARLG